MLRFSIGEIRMLAGDILNENDFELALDRFPSGFRAYLSAGKSLSARVERMGAVSLLLSLLAEEGIFPVCDIVRDSFGRPHFEDPSLPDFNLSHSGGFCAAVIGSGRVGIDLQEINPSFDPTALADRFFSAEEAALVRAGTSEEVRDRFFALWTKKEAFGKMAGAGLSATLRRGAYDPSLVTEKRMLGGREFYFSVCQQVDR